MSTMSRTDQESGPCEVWSGQPDRDDAFSRSAYQAERLTAMSGTRLDWQALDSAAEPDGWTRAFEVVDSELSVDGLLETNGWVGVKNTGRTGRDRC